MGFGIVTYRPRGRLGPRRQNFCQLVVIHRGSMIVTVDGREHPVGPGEAILLEPGHEEYFRFSDTRATTHSWCQLSPGAAPSFFSFPPAMFGKVAPCGPWLLDFMQRGWKIPSDARTPEGHQAILCAVLCAMGQFCGAFSKPEAGKQPQPSALKKARQIMEQHLAESLPLNELARRAGASKGHLIKLAREHWGTTPIERFWQVRLEMAARLLRETGLSVSEIAYRTGFANPFHFSRRFRQRFGQNPRLWRKAAWGIRGEAAHPLSTER